MNPGLNLILRSSSIPMESVRASRTLHVCLGTKFIAVPQPTTRDKLIASVRRNSRLAYLKAAEASASASASASAAAQTLSDQLLDSWSDSQIKEWADKNGIKVIYKP